MLPRNKQQGGVAVEKMIKELMEVGLTENEAKVYICLLRKQQFTATEISRCAKVNRSKIYSVLQSLNSKGLCHEKLGKVRKYQAENPETAFDHLKTIQTKKMQILDSLPAALGPIFDNQMTTQSPLEFIQVFNTPATIIQKHHTLETEAQKSVLSFCKPPYAMSNSLYLHEEQIITMEKGVAFRSIYEVSQLDLQFFCQQVKNFQLQGEAVRVADHLPIKLHVFDDQTVMFSMINTIDPHSNLTYMVIEHPDIAETLIATFELFWKNSMTVEEFLDREKVQL